MNVQILVDNPSSWIVPYAKSLCQILEEKKFQVEIIHTHADLKNGDVVFLLSCEKLLNASFRQLHRHNLVVHSSEVPYGRGWSPMTWQILEGKNVIPMSMLEAQEGADTGDVYLRDSVKLEGHELVDEIRHLMGQKIQEMCISFLTEYPIVAVPQSGEGSTYSRRKPQDAKLDIEKSLLSQFNLLRISDNEKYPAYFELNGKKYFLKIYKEVQQ
jgi:methionyl-tRNA formyltransferase